VLEDFWDGDMPLWQAFLILGVLGYAGIFFIGFTLSFTEDSWLEIPILYISPIICFAAFFAYCVFVTISIWRCGEYSTWYWRLLSRAYILLSIPIILSCSLEISFKVAGWPGEKFYPMQHEETRRIFGLYNEADMSIFYNPRNDKVDIDVGRLNKTEAGKILGRTPTTFTLEELEYFFGRQKHKDLIAVMFDKNILGRVELSHKIKKLNAYFFTKGYKRVVLLQGRGTGVGLYSDKVNPDKDR